MHRERFHVHTGYRRISYGNRYSLLVRNTPKVTRVTPKTKEISIFSPRMTNAIRIALMGTKLMNTPDLVAPMVLIPS